MLAILTGDIVNSTELTTEERDELTSKLQTFLLTHGYDYYYREREASIFFRGDSFQIALKEPERALEIGVITRIITKQLTKNKADIRFAIGVGDTHYETGQVRDSDGQAFWYSGRTLNKMKTERMLIKTENEEWDSTMNMTLSFADLLITGWSPEMAEVALLQLIGKTQSQAAKELGISQSAVNQRLKNAKFQLINQLLSHYKQAVQWIAP